MNDEDALPPGTVVGDYVLDAPIGRGGFAITYRGHHVRLTAQAVAVKEFFPDRLARRSQDGCRVRSTSSDFANGCDEFVREGQRLAGLKDPGIVRVINHFEANGTAYLVMDFEAGQTLEGLLGRRWEESRVRGLALALLKALQAVHESELLHRDINPSNIIVRADGSPVLIDFGAARSDLAQRTRVVTSVVTDGYSPTEQYGSNAKSQGPWTDLYSLGATLYHVVSGQRPVAAPDRIQAINEGEADPLAPAVSAAQGRYNEALLRWIDELLMVQRQQRPASATQALHGLRGIEQPQIDPVERTRPVDAAVPAATQEERPRTREVGEDRWARSALQQPPADSMLGIPYAFESPRGTRVVEDAARWAQPSPPVAQNSLASSAQRASGGANPEVSVGTPPEGDGAMSGSLRPLLLMLLLIALAATAGYGWQEHLAPYFEEREIREQVMEGLLLAGGPKITVTEFYYNLERFPSSNDEAGLPIASSISNNFVTGIAVGPDGVLTVTYGGQANVKIKGSTLVWIPSDVGGQMEWSCESAIDDRYLPTQCR